MGRPSIACQHSRSLSVRSVGPLVGWIALCGSLAISPIYAKPAFLHELSAGSKLTLRSRLEIPANQAEIGFGGATAGVSCRLRMRTVKPFERMLPQNRQFLVESVRRAGISYKNRITTTTYVVLNSKSISDIMCVAAGGSREPTLREFQAALASKFNLELPEAPAIDAEEAEQSG